MSKFDEIEKKHELVQIEMSFAAEGVVAVGRIRFSVVVLWQTFVAKAGFCFNTAVCHICRTDLSKIFAAVVAAVASYIIDGPRVVPGRAIAR